MNHQQISLAYSAELHNNVLFSYHVVASGDVAGGVEAVVLAGSRDDRGGGGG